MNPNLKAAFYYLGSSYVMVYKPGDDTEKNKEYGAKATEYLQKALELDPDNKNIIQALGDINDKMRNFELAEKYYLQVQKFTPNDPVSYYNLAGFYNNNAKYDKAIEMYEKRIALNPADPEGYLYLAGFYQDKRKWDDAIKNHEIRIGKIGESNMDEKAKNELLADAYYRLGVVCWNKSYQTPPDVMGSVERLQVVDKGFEALKKATELSPNFPDPWAYMGLLYRQKAVAEPLKKAGIQEAVRSHDAEIPGSPQAQAGLRAVHQGTGQGKIVLETRQNPLFSPGNKGFFFALTGTVSGRPSRIFDRLY